MNNGGKVEEIKREKDGKVEPNSLNRAGSDEFGQAISRIAVAQICENIGFQSFNYSALESLANIAILYLRDLGKTAKFYSNLAGRTECNVFDIILGLEDLGGTSLGFTGSLEMGGSLANLGIVRGIVEYAESAEEIPFAQPVMRFPVVRERRGVPSFVEMGETPGFKNVPAWLPAFPDSHTYVHTPVWNERVTDPKADKIELARQRRKAERSLLSLQQRLVGNGPTVGSTSEPPNDGQGSELGGSKNPCLPKPILDGGKGVSPVVLPGELIDEGEKGNDVPLLAAFAPAIEALKGGISESEDDGAAEKILSKPIQGKGKSVSPVVLPARFLDKGDKGNHIPLLETFAPAIEALICESESGDGAEKLLPDKRPAIYLEFKGRKKMLGEPLELSLRKKGIIAAGLGREDERDDKKRRAEYILRQSMENQQELTLL